MLLNPSLYLINNNTHKDLFPPILKNIKKQKHIALGYVWFNKALCKLNEELTENNNNSIIITTSQLGCYSENIMIILTNCKEWPPWQHQQESFGCNKLNNLDIYLGQGSFGHFGIFCYKMCQHNLLINLQISWWWQNTKAEHFFFSRLYNLPQTICIQSQLPHMIRINNSLYRLSFYAQYFS